MPELYCTVCDCRYNQDKRCCIGSIQVGGEDAATSTSTCCESFDDKCDCPTNEAQYPTPEMQIGCEAVNCVYNENCECHADKVSIEGDNCHECDETCCSTFRCC